MPVVFRYKGIRFFFYSNEGNPLEPMHIHAESGDGEAKIWVLPQIAIANSSGYNRKQLAQLMQLVEEHRSEIERAWNEHFCQDRQL
ncbi:DUF4160 domain-containing protein [Halomonas daqingensis]|uniref:DUF4160 domain-containing protein n=1 Tax=Billgrantia desiderata TaxID=52021 RepID=A0ABS9B150_9GAMM|nr:MULTISPECIES: DUF4160 domain-containing protein [Halomonas]MCE8030656.1 DUF4160 domain-containing protein [Halomonas desiderata]MCE8036706.1 DUF4160 domain-containing protein [Halomonas sp. MCCC 1A11062]MCE8041366.1 DUF4160 domain-containing protein [Halomonas desiderata]MCE8045941.1 DUF4160 domain-containing protein [Halomonas desiderata]NIC35162.1 DUF4160 domain-containing protein [Halomonas desiderata]